MTLTAAIVVLLVWSLYWNAPIVIEKLRENTLSAACSEVRPGMTFSEMNVVLQRRGPFPYENADFTTHEYSYGNARGSCVISMDQENDRVGEARFRALTSIDLSQGLY
jgi:hypothetical protein